MDFEKHQNLHTIVMLRDVIRKWWRLELTFADKHGGVQDWQRAEGVAPPNDFCRHSLSSKEGLRRCGQSVRVLHEKFKASKTHRRALFHDCHLNFCIVGAPLYIGQDYEGFLFVEGFARQPLGPSDAEATRARLGMPPERTGAEPRVPVLDASEQSKLADLLEFVVNELARQEQTLPSLSSELSDRFRFEQIIGRSGPMMEVFRLMEKVAHSDSTVLINGESGTGKELVARAIHHNGPRQDKPFVVQNCSAFNDNLLESALFGHTRGAFTGALREKKGLFEVADGGTFFLDEVGDMSPALQVKLLRVLQEGTFLPVGGTQLKEVDVRVIAATHKDLGELVKRGEFREDLFYRINVIRLQLPPLRERRDDLPVLIDHFLRKHHRPGQQARGLAPDALGILGAYTWPGNIRELENEIERLLVLGGDQDTIPGDLLSSRIRDAVVPGGGPFVAPRAHGKLHEAVEALEREMIHQGLVRTRNNKSRLARELGISRSNLILKIARYGLNKGLPDDLDDPDEE
ncbi:sigma-54-dependent Fis family transcriptional regulator [Corallococcus sp. H22C18031201]|uniref:sigma 54-interacting transcriptional regulator n=1 Tax=Citreicoccus inhibens TaxID=2849499 RepID=UPI000E7235EE|nr:sigma 54-interacting transcriptional regulator [Citreicoccus inhibens]MBU8897425.1 sigma 54-interacting transcriptional regulator [Citreicoccus inhibens]RJS16795.1 sigma-54-dependent Fis family transcriptional regulator [Corallococcus sp. H22C18031201]